MKRHEQFHRALESLFLAMFMAWTVGITIALINPQGTRDRQGVVEVYSMTDANAGV
jgi:hypothetical protein